MNSTTKSTILEIAHDYLNSANKIKARHDELKEMVATKKLHEQKKLEERIVILDAEYNHLLHTASHLCRYYCEDKPIRRSEVLKN